MRSKVTLFLLVAFLAVTGLAVPARAAAPATAPSTLTAPPKVTAPLKVTAKVVYLVDATTGTVQFARRETRRVPVASLTKIMTAYVVRRDAPLDAVVTITKADVRHAAANDATHAGLKAGERLTVRDLLYALLLPSGADAANALARRYGPGVKGFVKKMNAAARDLGMRDTFYTNADGLPQSGGDHSTAVDQVTLARAVMSDSVIIQIAATELHAVEKTSAHRRHVWRNTNRLLPDDAQGLKTGYTRAAGYCLMLAAERDGHTYIGAILGDTGDAARYRTARSLLDASAAAAAAV
ncbi:serine hydrolase [Sphaerisporangium sp. NPDC051011]|uniref:D-alanyl-D-alanine carboxypeptidase family protein n=1 Tax=Sphaerisporangium sp. NPDC051011 TaxID=3155792 RepID=UPI0033EEB046